MILKYKKFDKSLPDLEVRENGDWIDLYSRDDINITLKPNEIKKLFLRLNIAMELPRGYEANVVARSSSFKKYNMMLTNAYAVIDNAYSGDNDEWGALVVFLADEAKNVNIPAGTRLFQFRLNRTQFREIDIELTEVDKLSNPDRGGYGSTDK